jgi:hypothetical protein
MSLDNNTLQYSLMAVSSLAKTSTLEKPQHMSGRCVQWAHARAQPQIRLATEPVNCPQLSELQPGDGLVSPTEKGLRSISVAARTHSKRLAAEGKEAPTYVTRKITNGYALIRKS